jgi:pyruvate dehydrogenase E1 component
MSDSSGVIKTAQDSPAVAGADGVHADVITANGAAINGNAQSDSAISNEVNDIETREWLDSLDFVLQTSGPERVQELLEKLEIHAQKSGVAVPFAATTPYINTIAVNEQPEFPGDTEMERRITSLMRYNALAMVLRAVKVTKDDAGGEVGGHIATYASAATLIETGFNHFFKAANGESSGDQVYFQGHASPGIYARAFLEGRLSEENLINFRRELQPVSGLSSYPHPWLMPNFWQFPTVSMGLGPISSIYQARFNRYLEHRGLKDTTDSKVWAFLGDGECDEPETLGAITLAAREKLDNLTWIINCNLQRLDGPVRGNGKIIQELEGIFRGAGWNVIKVIWGHDWDELLENDEKGNLVKRMAEVVDGQYQKYTVETGAYAREHFFNTPELQELAKDLTDEEIRNLRRGGHDTEKVYAAYKAASEHKGQPTVILAKTVKGFGLGEEAEGRNPTHNLKKLKEDSLRKFRERFDIPVSEEDIVNAPFYKPAEDSPELKYLHERRKALGGYVPVRTSSAPPLKTPDESVFEEFYAGTGEKLQSSTKSFVMILMNLLRDKGIGKHIVPIIPDEARTFGMDGMFRSIGIYSSSGQLYEPVDQKEMAFYKESKSGQILEEGINEAGAMSSFIASGSSYSTHGVSTIPFFIYYSMFGFQRVGDLIWLAADQRVRGFLLGGTAGRTTLNGEGLQHEDGHSHLLAYPVPNLVAYDPAFAFELAVIIRDGIRRMYENGEDVFYYITLMNENYAMPAMPEGDRDEIKTGILKGMYRFKKSDKGGKLKAQLFGSGTILNEVIKAAGILEEKYNVAADIWSITSYKELNRDGMNVERANLLNPTGEQQVPYVTQCLQDSGDSVFVASSDYVKTLPDSIAKWVPGKLHSLGTDGFGRSETRAALRNHFEVDHRFVVLATLKALADAGKIKPSVVEKAIKDLGIDVNKLNPLVA